MTFGGGAFQPYDLALRDPERVLYLVQPDGTKQRVDVAKFLAPADPLDVDAIAQTTGAVLDLGSGPGRMVRAAMVEGRVALGIDASHVAVSIAQEQGIPVMHGSIFHDVPAQGTWGTAMLIDGNIGIGGDPLTLLARCSELVTGGGEGRVLVETHHDPTRDRVFTATMIDDLGRSSLPFPWAEVGVDALHEHASNAGLELVQQRMRGNRTFVEYASAR